MAKKVMGISEMIGSALGVIFGVYLIPVVYTAAITANVSADLAAVISLIPLAFVFAIANNAVRAFF